MHVWISERASGLSELKANKRNKSRTPPPSPPRPPASVQKQKQTVVSCQRLLGFINLLLWQRRQRLHPSLIINWFLRATRCSSLRQTICENRRHNNRRDHRGDREMMKRRPRLENNESTTAWGSANLQNTSLSLSLQSPSPPPAGPVGGSEVKSVRVPRFTPVSLKKVRMFLKCDMKQCSCYCPLTPQTTQQNTQQLFMTQNLSRPGTGINVCYCSWKCKTWSTTYSLLFLCKSDSVVVQELNWTRD